MLLKRRYRLWFDAWRRKNVISRLNRAAKSNIELDIVKIFNSDSLFAIIQSVRKNANKDILLLKTKLENLKNE